MKSMFLMKILTFTFFLLLVGSLQAGADGIICKNGSVYIGASKGEVINKCGKPLYVSGDTVKTYEKGSQNILRNGSKQTYGSSSHEEVSKTIETWTYIIDDCYRDLVFEGNVLKEIINRGLAQ